MPLPFFFHRFLDLPSGELMLDEDSSRHIAQVLRMQAGEEMLLTNGAGGQLHVRLEESHKKHSRVLVLDAFQAAPARRRLTLCVALLKNTARVEWMLEKATEMGVHRIVPLLTQRTVREKFRMDRMEGILVSAMLQSQQTWLPELTEPVLFDRFFQQPFMTSIPDRYIAHCLSHDRKEWLSQPLPDQDNVAVLIGPEGDFTEQEIDLAVKNNCLPVALGPNRLRTETAAIAVVSGYYLS